MHLDRIADKYNSWFATPLGAAIDRWEKEVTWRLAKPLGAYLAVCKRLPEKP
jgi:hypothetical protein